MSAQEAKPQKIGVRALACAICRTVGLDPVDVKELRITPTEMEVAVYKRNRYGHKYLEDKVAAVEHHTYPVRR